MLIISPHCREAMQKHAITEDEVRRALTDGETEFTIVVENEQRYGNVLHTKTRKLVAIWAYDENNNKRVIACYPLRRQI